MSFRAWFRPPRYLLPVFLVVTLPPSILILFGWWTITQDQALQRRQAELRREQLADLAVSALEQSVSAAEQALRDPAARDGLASDLDAVAVLFTSGRVEVFPEGRLVYLPVASPGIEAPDRLFAAGEELENTRRDYAGAAKLFRDLARSLDPAVRAGALIRLARSLRRAGQVDGAIAVYKEASAIQGAAVAGVPADLLARWALGGLLEEQTRTVDLQAEAESLYNDLLHCRWRIDRTAYELHRQDALRWLGDDRDRRDGANLHTSARGLAAAVDWAWNAWSHARPLGRMTTVIDGVRFTVLAQGGPERLTALVAGPTYVERQWLGKVAPLLQRQRADLAIRNAGAPGPSEEDSRRAASDTGLPWTVAITLTDAEAEQQRLAGRRAWWLAGFSTLIAFVAAGTYVIGRAIRRERAVARLQSDFVSAVSHEFRTPLTSLVQLTEILQDRRITSEERHQTYYQAMARQTERLRRLVESLLDFGRMEAGAAPYRLEPLDACALVRSVVEQFEVEARGRGYHVELSVNGSATIAADRDALTNALWNLLDNAVKYSLTCHTVWVSVERDDARLAIRVRDEGLGIPREEQREIFARFVRGAGAKTEGIKGSGIGLAIVAHVVKAHGGDVRVDSTPGEGSTFTMLLPVDPSCPAS